MLWQFLLLSYYHFCYKYAIFKYNLYNPEDHTLRVIIYGKKTVVALSEVVYNDIIIKKEGR